MLRPGGFLEHDLEVQLAVEANLAHRVASIARKEFVIVVDRAAALGIVVIVRAMLLLALASLWHSTLTRLVIEWMVLLLLPPVATSAAILQPAAVLVRLRVLLGFPMLALLLGVRVLVRFASEVLPVVCVNAYVTLVLLVAKRTPDSLKMEHVEVIVVFHFMEQID